jgi:hypothetical protein
LVVTDEDDTEQAVVDDIELAIVQAVGEELRRQLRRWARNRMKEDALTADPHEPAVVRLDWDVVKEMGTFFGLSPTLLPRYIRDFTPEYALRT